MHSKMRRKIQVMIDVSYAQWSGMEKLYGTLFGFISFRENSCRNSQKINISVNFWFIFFHSFSQRGAAVQLFLKYHFLQQEARKTRWEFARFVVQIFPNMLCTEQDPLTVSWFLPKWRIFESFFYVLNVFCNIWIDFHSRIALKVIYRREGTRDTLCPVWHCGGNFRGNTERSRDPGRIE